MTADFLVTAGLAASAALVFGTASALAIAFVYPLRRQRLRALDAAGRARRILWWTAAPVLIGLFMTAICFLPSALASVGIGSDHCPEHEDHHPHLCLTHRSRGPGSGIVACVAVLVGGARLGCSLRQQVRSRRLLSSLARISVPDAVRDIRIVQTEEALCFTAGLFRPRIYFSAGLAATLPPESQAAVLEHERAHVRRRDPLLRAIVSSLSLVHSPRTRRYLLEDFSLACEQACDRGAAQRVGDPLVVAEAILLVERLLGKVPARPVAPAVSFGGSDVDARVSSLLDTAPEAECPRGSAVAVAGATVAAVAAAEPIHHFTETFLGLFTR